MPRRRGAERGGGQQVRPVVHLDEIEASARVQDRRHSGARPRKPPSPPRLEHAPPPVSDPGDRVHADHTSRPRAALHAHRYIPGRLRRHAEASARAWRWDRPRVETKVREVHHRHPQAAGRIQDRLHEGVDRTGSPPEVGRVAVHGAGELPGARHRPAVAGSRLGPRRSSRGRNGFSTVRPRRRRRRLCAAHEVGRRSRKMRACRPTTLPRRPPMCVMLAPGQDHRALDYGTLDPDVRSDRGIGPDISVEHEARTGPKVAGPIVALDWTHGRA